MSLPSGYRQLEYIQSSGTQYVDTGFRPNQDTTVEVTFETTQSAQCGVAVTDQAWQSNEFGIWANCVSYGSQTDQTVVFYGIGKVTARLDRNKLYKNGELIWTASAATFSCPSNLTLMALNRNGTIQEKTAGNWYSSKIYDNGTLIRDYTPCQTIAGEIGLWDDVNEVFYGNVGTGTFTAGPVIAIAIDKSEITELEYIQGSGTQYINTGIMPNQDTRLDLQASFAQTGSHTIVGADLGWTANGFSIGVGFAHYGTETSNINGMNDGLMHLISMDKNTLSVDGVSVYAFSAQTFFVGYPLVLFANNRSGSIEEITTMTLCSSQIYDNGTIVRNYIPCQTSSGEIGLWDALNNMFYCNVGSGTFAAGPVKVSPLNLPVNIGGTWKNANEVFVNIGGTWKTVDSAYVNIGGTWKELG